MGFFPVMSQILLMVLKFRLFSLKKAGEFKTIYYQSK